MTIQSDYHLHTKYCHHATGEMEEYVQSAIRKKLKEIGFADHAPAEDFDPKHRMTLNEFEVYIQTITTLQSRYAEISIRIGVEADFYPGFEDPLEKLLKRFPIDYVIGSVHYVNGDFVFPRQAADFPAVPASDWINRYFEITEQGIRSGLVDIVGHSDVVKWCFPASQDLILTRGTKMLDVLASQACILELNTSGLRKKPEEIYPHPSFLQEAAARNVPVCTGSDAHRPEDVAADFGAAARLLWNSGYTSVHFSDKNMRIFLPGDTSNRQ